MAASPTPPPAELLLAHVAWVKRLVRLLVADPQDAADVEQETWREALERPPKERGRLRGWLTAVARNAARRLARSKAARARQMRAVEQAPSLVAPRSAEVAGEIAERAELHRRVVDAVLALEELYRTPLLLRFFDDLPATQVAARLGVPVETARTRIKRGVALLRERLGGTGRGGTAGLAAFLPLLEPSSARPEIGLRLPETAVKLAVVTTVVAIGGAAMSKVGKTAAAIVAVVLAAVGGYQLSLPDPAIEPRGEVADRGFPPGPTAAADDDAALRTPAVGEAVRKDEGRTSAPSTTTEAASAIEGVVTDASGAPVAGARVILDRLDATRWWNQLNFRRALRSFPEGEVRPHTWRATTSASDGRFRFDDVDRQHRWGLAAIHDPLGTGWCDELDFAGADPVARATIVLEAGVVVFGSVRDPNGVPIGGASVWLTGTTAAPPAKPSFFMGQFEDMPRTGEDGSYRSLSLPWRYVAQRADVHGRADFGVGELPWQELPAGATEVRRDLVVPWLMVLRGRILGPDGLPARLAQTVVPKLGDDAKRTQTRQTLAVAAFARDPRQEPNLVQRLFTNEPGLAILDTDHAYGTLSIEEDRYELPVKSAELRFVAVLARDELLGVAEIPQPPVTTDITIDPARVPERSLMSSLRLHFRDGRAGREGMPLPGVNVAALTLTRGAGGQLSHGVLNFGVNQELLPDRDLDLPRTPLSLLMSCEGFVSRCFAVDASRPDAPSERTFTFVPASGAIALHVEDEEGAPVAKSVARVYQGREREAVIAFTEWVTDERGDVRIEGLPAGECLVVVEAPDFAPAAAVATIKAGDAPVDLLLERGYELTLRARLADGSPSPGGQFSICDESGAPLYDLFHPGAGALRLAGRTLRLVDGTYTVHCRVPTFAAGSATFLAAPGIEVPVTLERAVH